MEEESTDAIRAGMEFDEWWKGEGPVSHNDDLKLFARKVWIAAWANGYTQGCEDNY